jgi:hypothetical protein
MKRHPFTLKRFGKQIWIYFIEKRELLAGILLVIVAGLTLEVFAASVDHAVEKLIDGESIEAGNWWFIGVCFVLMPILSALIWLRRHVFQSLRVLYQIASNAMPKPYLVIFVSRQQLIKNLSDIPDNGPMTIPGAILNRKNLLDDAELIADTQKPQWSWEMVLRGIAPHLSPLRRIYLVGSKDSQGESGVVPGTFAQREMLRRFLAPYLVAAGKAAMPSGAASMIVPWEEPVDFENFEAVHEALESIHNKLVEELVEEVELCVDITGGQKPTSAAAGLFTVNKDVVIQYVQTNRPKKPQMYDVRLQEWPKKSD